MATPILGRPLYQRDASIHRLMTKIISCQSIQSITEAERSLFKSSDDTDHVITTEETIFHPQGGGQPSDIGQMKSEQTDLLFNVKLVRKTPENQIYHLGSFADATTPFQKGDSIVQNIDTVQRNYHSRYHTAGHILGLAVKQLRPQVGEVSEIKANHAPGMAFVEFRGLIGGEHKGIIQERATELVKRNLAVTVDWWNEEKAKSHCVALPEGFSVPDEGDIRVVDVEGAGAYPCGGTHLPGTCDIGGIVVRRISRQKGVTKISYEITDV
ncbi:hypothetical protein ASPWEDRAFT_44845 [Aspergillus wentii DTO 134E9]|uniref:Alanyl-transfer RNA synthetases family profile domain-containing protein n=1 Tax=Aspergillus wentii DTO 134E9 TaxID=1073089 RepID=A0A1L9R7K9_ASPWE|nr:uncharacterized protein ASPWEDRAFT_44845 [Aspergillus wentii DTO 134E9]KAI9927492.1 hypothetical protein MW887_003108 [Aspergillus wentii]OJJ30867.1 hypothetical protein ASPWEDRAFT_44845 [Aspergillus wentii DTO 134E9]